MKKLFSTFMLVASLSLILAVTPSFALVDHFEPNNTYDTAFHLPIGVQIQTILSSNQDNDYYALTTGYVQPNSYMDVTLWSPSGYDYFMYVTKYLGQYAGVELIISQPGLVSYRVPVQSYTTYYVLVNEKVGSVTTNFNYVLDVSKVYVYPF